MNDSTANDSMADIAIIGMAGRFPGASNIDEFWENLRGGVESISFFSEADMAAAGISPDLYNRRDYVRARGVLEGVDLFDAQFFGFTPREAEITDPQHRLFIECCWEALEHACYDPGRYEGLIGVYAGASSNSYFQNNIYSMPDILQAVGPLQLFIGNDKDHLTTRVSYKLNLRGPSLAVQTACSTSLVAVHLACQNLIYYYCDIALAGGVSIQVPQKAGYLYQTGSIMSPDGHCYAFDSRARGVPGGSGVGVVVLKRLDAALSDGDHIHAVIKGSAINNDGSVKTGYTAPSVDGQAEVIVTAQAVAGVDADSITYVEAHGTGTPLGDAVEVAALTQAFRASTSRKGFCALGSVKTNIGHLDAAAGVASLIKTVLALKHKMTPPSLNFNQPSSEIDLESSPFYVSTRLSRWQSEGVTPRRAGVSAFGIGGTNAHLIVEEPPVIEASDQSPSWQLLVQSAKTLPALDSATAKLKAFLQANPEVNLGDIAYSLQIGRTPFKHRRVLVCRDHEDAIGALEARDPRKVLTAFHEDKNNFIAFMFTGQGSQHTQIARQLYKSEPHFRDSVDTCSLLLQQYLRLDLRDLFYPQPENEEEATRRLNQTFLTQPAVFVIDYSLAKLWLKWGVKPSSLFGHSIGEYVAACLAGVFSLEEALMIVAARGRLIQQLPEGAMTAVRLSADYCQSLLGTELSIAAINGPSDCVLSGPTHAVDALERRLEESGSACQRLRVSHAFHSAMVEPVLSEFVDLLDHIQLKPPRIPYLSTVTGDWTEAANATSPGYWARHLRETVRFADCVQKVLERPDCILLEVGPGQTLSALVKRHPEKNSDTLALSSLPGRNDKKSDVAHLLETVGQLWMAGVQLDWSSFNDSRKRFRVPLPGYPYERSRYWLEPAKQIFATSNVLEDERKAEVDDWFYAPGWSRSITPQLFTDENLSNEKSNWLLFGCEGAFAACLAERLEQSGQSVITVLPGESFARRGNGVYVIDPGSRETYDSLIKELKKQQLTPHYIVHLWSSPPQSCSQMDINSAEQVQRLGFYSLLFLAQALGNQILTDSIRIQIVTSGVHEVTGDEPLHPARATVLGPCKVIPQEYQKLSCRNIDIVVPAPGTSQEKRLVDLLIAEMLSDGTDDVVAYRGNHRWVQDFEPIRLRHAQRGPAGIKEGGVYLITGAESEFALALAERIIKTPETSVALVPSSTSGQEDYSNSVSRIASLPHYGTRVRVFEGSIAAIEPARAVVAEVVSVFGRIDGVFHLAESLNAGLIHLKAPETAAGVLAPKLNGSLALDAALAATPPDFMVIFSSIVSLLGGVGQVSYCAANSFADAYARHKSAFGQTLTTAINWDILQVDSRLDSLVQDSPELSRQLDALRKKFGIRLDEGISALDRVLALGLPQVVVSRQDFKKIFKQRNTYGGSNLLKQADKGNSVDTGDARADSTTGRITPGSELEQTLAEIMQQLLGIEAIGVHDNFFDLGANSLIAIQLLSRIRDAFDIELPINTLFDAPTAAGLADLVLEKQAEQEFEGIEELLESVEKLSSDEVKQQIAQALDMTEQGNTHEALSASAEPARASMRFSLFFFSDDGSKAGADKYRLLLESARFADEHSFIAVWIPERHFQDFGGLYPNPSVLAAALAMTTERIQIRAGSVVLPLHNPIRVAEEWSIIDNLSNGRAGISFASGWHHRDFVLSPENYQNRKEVMFRDIELIRRLWIGERLQFRGINGQEIDLEIFPKPLQPMLPFWVTSAGNPETWKRAGAIGGNLLTGMQGETIKSLTGKIATYRQSLAEHGHDPQSGKVSVMLHTFVGEDSEQVKELVRKPLVNYFRTFINNSGNPLDAHAEDEALRRESADDRALVAFEYYFRENSLIGSVNKCSKMINQLANIGVDEVACLIDFGLDAGTVMQGLDHLNALKQRHSRPQGSQNNREHILV